MKHILTLCLILCHWAEAAPPLSNHLRITLGTPEQAKRFFAAFESLMTARKEQKVAS